MKTHNETYRDEASQSVLRIEQGFREWRDLSLKGRIKIVKRLRKTISKNARKIAEVISEETGRPFIESLSQEVLAVLEMAKFCEKKYPQWLAQRKLSYRRPGFLRKKSSLYFEPLGPVAVFSPQNFPFSLGMMTLIYAILPGNSVVLKPSENSTLVPAVIEEILETSGLVDFGAASIISGGPSTGEWLIEQPSIKKIFFFGNGTSGEAVARKCVEFQKTFVLEMGGGSTAYVCEDADVEQAAAGLAWSSFYSGGHSCVSTERIVVDEKISEKFLTRFKEKVADFQREWAEKAKQGVNDLLDISRLNELIEGAKAHGADVFQAGQPNSQENNGLFPFTVISHSPSNMLSPQEDIFGPVVVVQAAISLENAIADMNRHCPPMGVSIWSRNLRQATLLANKITTGMVWINDSSFGLPHLPWGGIGKSGWGRLFSEFSLQEVTTQKWISAHPARFSRARFWWNPYTTRKEKMMVKIARHFL